MKETRATQNQILQRLKKLGEQTVKQLSSAIGITSMGIRQHLLVLENAGLIQRRQLKGLKGRPAEIWRLTSKAHSRYPDSHTKLALKLMESISELFGDDGLDKTLDHIANEQIHDTRKRIGLTETFEEKLEALTEARSRDGYMAHLEKNEDGDYLLIQSHLPLFDAAKRYPQYRSLELNFLREVLGETVSVEIQEHILDGDRRSIFLIKER